MREAPDKLTFIDLFCGCGGFSLGLQRAGFDCVDHELAHFAKDLRGKQSPDLLSRGTG